MVAGETIHFEVHVSGKVQGVWYRKSAQVEAERLGLRGTVENLPDGSVLVHAEGPQAALDSLVAWCKKGPPLAKVAQVEVFRRPLVEYPDFSVRR